MKPEIVEQAEKVREELNLLLEMLGADANDGPEAATRSGGDEKKPPPGVPPGQP